MAMLAVRRKVVEHSRTAFFDVIRVEYRTTIQSQNKKSRHTGMLFKWLLAAFGVDLGMERKTGAHKEQQEQAYFHATKMRQRAGMSRDCSRSILNNVTNVSNLA